MLTKKQYNPTLQLLKLASKLGVLPWKVDTKNCRFEKHDKSKWRSMVSFCILFLDALFITVRVLQTYIFSKISKEDIPLLPSSVELMFCMYIFTTSYMQYLILFPEDCRSMFNSIFEEDQTTKSVQGINGQELRAQDKTTHSLTDYFILFLCCLTCEVFLFFIVIQILTPQLPILLHSVLPPACQSWGTTALFMIPEVIAMITWCSTALFGIGFLLLYAQKISDTLQAYIQVLRNSQGLGPRDFRVILKAIQVVILEINIFNALNGCILYIVKVYCYATAVTSGFVSLKFFNANLIFGCYNFIVFFNANFFFLVNLSKAHCIPDSIVWLKARFFASIEYRSLPSNMKSLVTAKVRAIPNAGIRVGGFGFVERGSTLVFVDFVVCNIVNLLVMHK